MDTPTKRNKKKKNVEHQRQYRKRKQAAVDGMEEVRARKRQRYYERSNRLKANGKYEAFKKMKATQAKQRYHNMSVEKQEEVKRKTLFYKRHGGNE